MLQTTSFSGSSATPNGTVRTRKSKNAKGRPVNCCADEELQGEESKQVSSSCMNLLQAQQFEDYDAVPDQILRYELSLFRMTGTMMAVYVLLWLPVSASNVVYGVCQSCRDRMTFAEVITFKWLAYGSAALCTVILSILSEEMRQACLAVLTMNRN